MLENKLFEALLDVVPFGAYAVDIKTFEIVYANKLVRENMYAPQEEYCWEKIYGASEKCSWCTIGKITDKKHTSDFFDELDDKWVKSFDEFISWPDGRDVKYSILVDTTSQKEAEGSMIQSHAKLAVRSKQVAKTNKNLQIAKLELQKTIRQLEEERNKAQEATKSKSDFLATMSHEIRTPMNGIIGMSHLLKNTTLDEKQTHYIDTINNNATSLLGIINDILDVSKMEAGKLNIESINFNLKDMIKNVISLVEFSANEKHIEFDVICDDSIPINLNGDPLRLSQILLNLVNNAIKFTQKGYVKVIISNIDNVYKFEVKDSGIGISKSQLENLFQAFTQADSSTTRRFGGTGLGLFISKQLIEIMNGKIWATSEVDKGSSFYFEICLNPNDNTIEDKKAIDENELSQLKTSQILIVEDNITNQEIIMGLLESSGIDIDLACNGQEAINKVNSKDYELILMDLQMPIMGGIEATKIIRENNSAIPIIALSANVMEDDIKQTKLAGMNEHLNKPIEVNKLYSILLQYISKKCEIKTLKVNENIDNTIIPNFQYIDTTLGLSHMANNKKLYLKVLKDFYKKYQDLSPVGLISSGKLEELNDNELELVAHTVKGLASSIGANKLSEISAKIEDTRNKELFEVFYEELENVLEELQDLEQNLKQENLQVLDKEKRDELFNLLKESASRSRGKQGREIMEQLKKYSLEDSDKRLVVQIEKYLNNRNYKSIMEII